MKTIAWWSGGITSAVACRLAIDLYEDVELIYIETGSHHEDTMRFKADCEKWYGQEIKTLQSEKYEDHFDVIISTGFVNGAGGARCTLELKKEVRFKLERQNQYAAQVWGFEFTAKEINIAIRTQEQYAETNPLFPLIEKQLTKNECAGIVVGAGIKLPEMYLLGYSNNNCIGCVKGGAGYWNKIRVDFPAIFKRMAETEREVGYTCLTKDDERLYLDELDPKSGYKSDIVLPECGLFCQVNFADIMSDRVISILSGEKSIYDTAA